MNVVVLDINPIVTENCVSAAGLGETMSLLDTLSDNITYYQCDVSKWDEVEAVAKKIKEEVRFLIHLYSRTLTGCCRLVTRLSSSTTRALHKGSSFWI